MDGEIKERLEVSCSKQKQRPTNAGSSFVSFCFPFSAFVQYLFHDVPRVPVRHGFRFTKVDPSGCTAPPDLAVECRATALHVAWNTSFAAIFCLTKQTAAAYMSILSDVES